MAWNIVLVIGALLQATGAILGAREHFWLQNARKASGTVIESVASRGSKGVTYRPRIEFTAGDGSQHSFLRSYSSSPPDFSVGQTVPVAYDARSYEGRILTFGHRFGFAAVVFVVGLAMVLLSVTFIVGRQMVPAVYLD